MKTNAVLHFPSQSQSRQNVLKWAGLTVENELLHAENRERITGGYGVVWFGDNSPATQAGDRQANSSNDCCEKENTIDGSDGLIESPELESPEYLEPNPENCNPRPLSEVGDLINGDGKYFSCKGIKEENFKVLVWGEKRLNIAKECRDNKCDLVTSIQYRGKIAAPYGSYCNSYDCDKKNCNVVINNDSQQIVCSQISECYHRDFYHCKKISRENTREQMIALQQSVVGLVVDDIKSKLEALPNFTIEHESILSDGSYVYIYGGYCAGDECRDSTNRLCTYGCNNNNAIQAIDRGAGQVATFTNYCPTPLECGDADYTVINFFERQSMFLYKCDRKFFNCIEATDSKGRKYIISGSGGNVHIRMKGGGTVVIDGYYGNVLAIM